MAAEAKPNHPRYFVPIYGSYYHFICESALGLYHMLERESILATRDCTLWYQGYLGEIVQLFSRNPIVSLPVVRPFIRDASLVGENITLLKHVPLSFEKDFRKLIPMAQWLDRQVPSVHFPQGITVIRRVGKREYRETDELAARLQSFRIPVRVVQMELESFVSQVNIMRNTSILIAPHGAGTMNQIFMPAGGHVIELFPKGYSDWHAAAVAKAFGHTLIEIESTQPGVFRRKPSEEVMKYFADHNWPDRKTVQALRGRLEELHRVVRDVATYSIPPEQVMNTVEEVLSRAK